MNAYRIDGFLFRTTFFRKSKKIAKYAILDQDLQSWMILDPVWESLYPVLCYLIWHISFSRLKCLFPGKISWQRQPGDQKSILSAFLGRLRPLICVFVYLYHFNINGLKTAFTAFLRLYSNISRIGI